MGYNTTVVVYNDALHAIARDPAFGQVLANACRDVMQMRAHIDVPALNHANACMVVECHHADHLVPVLVGGNLGEPVRELYLRARNNVASWEIDLLKALAKKHGFDLHKKRGI